MVGSGSDIRVQVVSPPDRDTVVASILIQGVEFAEVDLNEENVSLEIYPKWDGEAWHITKDELYRAIDSAVDRLSGFR